MQDVAAPIAKDETSRELTRVTRASAYVCRPRNVRRQFRSTPSQCDRLPAKLGMADENASMSKPAPSKAAAFSMQSAMRHRAVQQDGALPRAERPDHELHVFHFDLITAHRATYCH